MGAGSYDHAFVFPDVAHDEADLGLGHVIHLHLLDASLSRATGYNLCHACRVAVHRAIDDDHAFLTLLFAPLRVFAEYPGEVAAPYQAMRRCNHLDLQPAELLDGLQGLHGHLAHDVGIVTAHVVLIKGEVDLVVEDATVQGTESAESIVAEDDLAALFVGHHRLRPVYHRHHEELQGVFAEAQRLAFGHHLLVGDGSVVGFQRSEGLGVAHHLNLGELPQHGGHSAAVVRLVVINNKVIHLPAL